MQVKNEVDIIDDWLRWHLHLFGEGNIHVLDHESTDGTEKILQKYQSKIELRIVRNPFLEKGKNITAEMCRYRNACDMLLPLDADEFVTLEDSADRAAILKEFQKCDLVHWCAFKFRGMIVPIIQQKSYDDVLGSIEEFFIDDFYRMLWFKKSFFNALFFLEANMGNHYGSMSHCNEHYY